jgi:uncharacterized protein YacL
VIGVIGVVLGIMIGFMFWVINTNLWNYTIVWVIVTLVFIVTMIILFYIGGKGRIKEEKERIAQAQIKENAMRTKKMAKDIEHRATV